MGVPVWAMSVTGPVDSSNRMFYTPTPYTPGTLAVFLNGQLKPRDQTDGYVETNPATGEFTMNEAPLSTTPPAPPTFTDKLSAFYIDTGPDAVVVIELIGLTGVLQDTVSPVGQLAAVGLHGTVEAQAPLDARLRTEAPVASVVQEGVALTGVIHA